MVLSLVYGCVTEKNYKMLSFFFDGVPEPGKVMTTDTLGRAGSKDQAKTEVRGVVHGPYAARLCKACHEAGTSNNLILPIDQLCANCHNIRLDKKWIHGPVVSGGCRVCHMPHSSRFGFLLVADSKDFCFYCHNRADVFKNPVHQGSDSSCTTCHDAHMSDTKYLLK